MTASKSAPKLALFGLVALFGSACGVYGLRTSGAGVAAEAATASERAPEFVLADTDGSLIALDDLLAGGEPAVLVFYRGHW